MKGIKYGHRGGTNYVIPIFDTPTAIVKHGDSGILGIGFLTQ